MPGLNLDLFSWLGFIALGQGSVILLYLATIIRKGIAKEALVFGVICMLLFNLIHDLLVHIRLLLDLTFFWGLGGIFNPLMVVLIFFVIRSEPFNKRDLLHFVFPLLYILYRFIYKFSLPLQVENLVYYYLHTNEQIIRITPNFILNLFTNCLFPIPYLYVSVFILFKLKNYSWKNWNIIILSVGIILFLNQIFFYSNQLWVGATLWIWKVKVGFMILQVGMLCLGLLLIINPEEKGPKYQDSSLSIGFSKKYYADFIKILELQKAYTDPSISLQSIADQMGVYSKHLSQAINEQSGNNFKDLINAYRILEAQKRLSDASQNHYTVESIGYEVGFNSKTTFYRTFKQTCNMSPAKYRKLYS